MLKHERGFGLIEVMVALMLLAVAVLGFSALQMRAIQATDETLIRSDAMVMIRNLSEDMRLYPEEKQKYIAELSSPLGSILKDCQKTTCNVDERIKYNAEKMKSLAADSGIKLSAIDCKTPSSTPTKNIERICIIAAWEGTNATAGADVDNDCLDMSRAYHTKASCVVMEAY